MILKPFVYSRAIAIPDYILEQNTNNLSNKEKVLEYINRKFPNETRIFYDDKIEQKIAYIGYSEEFSNGFTLNTNNTETLNKYYAVNSIVSDLDSSEESCVEHLKQYILSDYRDNIYSTVTKSGNTIHMNGSETNKKKFLETIDKYYSKALKKLKGYSIIMEEVK